MLAGFCNKNYNSKPDGLKVILLAINLTPNMLTAAVIWNMISKIVLYSGWLCIAVAVKLMLLVSIIIGLFC